MRDLGPGEGPEQAMATHQAGSPIPPVQTPLQPQHLSRHTIRRAVRLLIGATLVAAGLTVMTALSSQAAETQHGRTLGGLTRALGLGAPVDPDAADNPILRLLGGAVPATDGTSQPPHSSTKPVATQRVSHRGAVAQPAQHPVRRVLDGVVRPVLASPVVSAVVTPVDDDLVTPLLAQPVVKGLVGPVLATPLVTRLTELPVVDQLVAPGGLLHPVVAVAAPMLTPAAGLVAGQVSRLGAPAADDGVAWVGAALARATSAVDAVVRRAAAGDSSDGMSLPVPSWPNLPGVPGPAAGASGGLALSLAAAFGFLCLIGARRGPRLLPIGDRVPRSLAAQPSTRPA